MNDMSVVQQFVTTTLVEVLFKVLAAMAFWFVGRWLISKVVALMQAAMGRNHVDTTLTKYLGSIVAIALNVALVLGILGYFGVQTTSFAALIASAGVAIGAAWSGMLGNFAAGAFMLVLRPFKVGDFVAVGGVTGTVHELGLFGTTLVTPDNVMTIVGNGKIFADTIQNYSALPVRRDDRVARLSVIARITDLALQGRGGAGRQRQYGEAARGQPARHEPQRAGDRGASVHPHRSLLAGLLRHQRGHRADLQGGRLAAADADAGDADRARLKG